MQFGNIYHVRHCKSFGPAGAIAISAFLILPAPNTTRPKLIFCYSSKEEGSIDGYCDFLLYCVSHRLWAMRTVGSGRGKAI